MLSPELLPLLVFFLYK
uniref:Uncharacterized protein n=1 Tax=Arundo donax TaxID=35708 RepID=A0A0A8YZ08_ARUDO